MTWLAGFAVAWLRQRVTGIGAQALAATIAVVVAVTLFVLGVWWLRHDARMDERTARDAYWEQKLANARLQAAAVRQARQRASERIAAERAAWMAKEVSAARERATWLAGQMVTRPRVTCYPKAIIGRMNE